MSAADRKELMDFLEFRFRPVAEELSASGAGHVIVCFVPAAERMKILTDLPAPVAAFEMRRMADALYLEADKRAKDPATAIVIPPANGGGT